MDRTPMALVFMMCLIQTLFSTTVLVNSQNYEDIISASVFAASQGYAFAFTIDPRQAVFITRYYTAVKTDPVIYLEGNQTILSNMATMLQESKLGNLTIVQNRPVQEWVADQFPRTQAILVGGAYGQDALSAAPYAAVSQSPIFFIDDPSKAQATLTAVRSRGYAKVMVYGSLASQLAKADLDSLPPVETVDTGSRYSNNIEIVKKFLELKSAHQVMFVSGQAFEKSMVDSKYPLVLVGRSTVPQELVTFLSANNISSGVVFSGDSQDPAVGSNIVDGVAKLRALNPNLSIFIKFGEGYSGVNQALPLMIAPLPSPRISLDLLNISYNVGSRQFEIRAADSGDFIFLSASVLIEGIGSAESSQITLEPGQTTTLGVDLDATRAISDGRIPSADVTAQFGEDSGLADNIETVTFVDIPLSTYEDNSSVRLSGIAYSSEHKAFILHLQGDGWVSGTARFMLGTRPIVLDVPPTLIKGSGDVEVKFLLSADEERYVSGLNFDYLIRYGSRPDVLLKEDRGRQEFSVLPAAPGPWFGGADGSGGGLSLPMLCAGGAILVAALAGARYYLSQRDGGFD